MDGVIHCAAFRGWLLSLSTAFLGFIRELACCLSNSVLFVGERRPRGWMDHFVFIRLLARIWVVPTFWLSCTMLACRFYVGTCFQFLSVHLEVGLLDLMALCVDLFEKLANSSPQWLCRFPGPLAACGDSGCSLSLSTLVIFCVKNTNVIIDLLFPDGRGRWASLPVLAAHLSVSWGTVYSPWTPFFSGVTCFYC